MYIYYSKKIKSVLKKWYNWGYGVEFFSETSANEGFT